MMPNAAPGRTTLTGAREKSQSERVKKTSLAPLVAAFVLAALAAGFLIALMVLRPATNTSDQAGPLNQLEAVFYKSPTCGCCHVYAEALAAAGVRLTVINNALATQETKRQHGIPPHAYSCHTFTIAGYVIEGHVPLVALELLITGRPSIDGIVLPGMPIGTPGMPGTKTAPYEILALKDGQLTPYLTL